MTGVAPTAAPTPESPLPWTLNISEDGEGGRYCAVLASDGSVVCSNVMQEPPFVFEQDQQFIVHAATVYPELLAALKALVGAYEDPTMDDPHTLVLTAKKAIDQAEGR